MRRKIAICVLAVLVIATIVTAVIHILTTEEAKEETQTKEIHLNEILTNEMSDFPGLENLDKRVLDYMERWELRGAQLSVMRNDSLLYAKGYGLADEGQEMQPSNIMRLASVSKLITAVGIMVLQERGELSLSDKVFGSEGILNDSTTTARIRDLNYYKITVEDLLRHKGGFSGRMDPMFNTLGIMQGYGLDAPPSAEELTNLLVRRRLNFVPGSSQHYSNFGYLLLSLVIEKISGQDYEDFMEENVLIPAGCYDMHLAHNYYEEKFPNEVRYFLPYDDEPVEEYNGSGRMVERCYGGNDIPGLRGAGAWVASTPELARFVASIDGKTDVPDIISEESVAQMTEYFDESTYSLGWNDTNPETGWTRTGTFSGTSALVKYFPDGECWIFVTNNSTWKGPRLSKYTSALFSKLRCEFSSQFPSRNLFLGE